MYSKLEFGIHGIAAGIFLLGNFIFGSLLARVCQTVGLAPVPKVIHERKNLSDQIIIVTGSNVGIGKSTSESLAKLGATVVLACRDIQKGMSASSEINKLLQLADCEDYPYAKKGKSVFMRLDLCDLQSVIEFSNRVKQEFDRVDVLINNAGINYDGMLSNGIQMTFQVNYLGHYLLTRSLLSLLQNSRKNEKSTFETPKVARVINLSSVMHHLGQPDFKKSSKSQFSTSMRVKHSYYDDTKLYMNLLTLQLNHLYDTDLWKELEKSTESCPKDEETANELSKRPIVSISVNPGAVSSNIWRYVKLKKIFDFFTGLVFLNVNQGSATSVTAATMDLQELRNHQKSKILKITKNNENNKQSLIDLKGGKMKFRPDLPYLIPYSMPFDCGFLGFEMLGRFAGSKFGAVTLPISEYCLCCSTGICESKNEEINPVELAKKLWEYSAELSKEDLVKNGISADALQFLD